MTAALIVAAALLLGGREMLDHAKAAWAMLPLREISWRQAAAAGLIIAALVSFNLKTEVVPGPPPPPPAGLSLVGLFRGPTGAEDAAVVAALCGELADEIQWDGRQEEPAFRSGVALDELRQRARELRCRGVSIGQRQPAARDAIAAHLTAAVGESGGPIDQEQRAAWVRAFREISEAAADVTR